MQDGRVSVGTGKTDLKALGALRRQDLGGWGLKGREQAWERMHWSQTKLPFQELGG